MTSFPLVASDGRITSVTAASPPRLRVPEAPIASRRAYAAAHVVPVSWGDNTPGADADIDWDATLATRHRLWSWGLGVADAMDTAQRNMGLDPAATTELVRRSAAEAAAVGGALVVGVNTDHVAETRISSGEVTSAYLQQLHAAEDVGAQAVLMASRHLNRAATSAAEFEAVYGDVLERAGAPVVLHWLGDVFDPQLRGYFGSTDTGIAARTVLRIIERNREVIDGIKVSLLDADAEIALRRRLPDGVRMFTGDDFHYVDLIAGDDRGHSDALLGAFAAIPGIASAALQAMDAGDAGGFRRILEPTTALSRQIFAAPTQFYKTGIAFLSWLNGHQSAFSMVGGLHVARSLPHLSRIVELADACGAIEDPDIAAARWSGLLRTAGIGT